MEAITIGIGTSSIGRFLPYIGVAAGLFQKQNIAVEIINQLDEEKVVDDIVNQVTPIGTPNAPSLIFSRLNGNDLVIIGGILNRPAFYLVANQKIASVTDLEGKKVGINQPRRMAGMMMLALLRRWRFESAHDLELVDLGLNDRSFEALRSGEIAAALLPPEKAFLLESEGFHMVADTLNLDCHWVPLATTRRFLTANPELVTRVAVIYRDSIHFFKSEPQATLKTIGEQLAALNSRTQVLEKCYRVFAELFEPTLTSSLASLSAVLEEVALQDPRAKKLSAASLVGRILNE
jgi:ABC-type nitrate/sulfonate/bicarbonate transport system substrate-binding protein